MTKNGCFLHLEKTIIFNDIINILSKKGGIIYDNETLYWMGYIYLYWHFYTGENSKEIYKQDNAELMNVVYFAFHTMSPEMAIDRIKEIYQEKRKK